MKQTSNNIQHNQQDDKHLVDAFVGAPPLNYNEIYLGDSFELCERVPAKTVDMILEDMPYNTTACEWDIKIDLEKYWESRLRLLKPTGVVCLTASQPFTTDLINSNRKMFRYEWIWEKTVATGFLSANKRPLKIHENILIFAESQPTYNPQKTYNPKNRQRYIPAGDFHKDHIYGGGRIEKQYDASRYPTTIQKFKSIESSNQFVKKETHPTQKPVDLFEYLIRTYTNAQDLVFDGFGGSGTTAIAAHRSNRNFIVIEKEKKYFDLAKRRLDNERAQTRLF